MIVDTSALVAILYREPETEAFAHLIHGADICRISVVSHVELTMVVESQMGAEEMRQAEDLIRRGDIAIKPVTIEQGTLARQAFFNFGKGRHKAKLNFGDCFAYALAKAKEEPLLFKGRDFNCTDIRPAFHPS